MKGSPCKNIRDHVLVQIISFHKKNFCVSMECTKCHIKETVKNMPYSKLAGKFGVIVRDKKMRKPLEI